MIHFLHESLFSRFAATRVTSHRPGKKACRSCGDVCHLLEGMGEAMLLDGWADAAAFKTCIEQIQALSLRPGQIVILDNLSIHLGPWVKQAIEERSCQLLFLPAYSPDFSPIEGGFSKLKAHLRCVGARTCEALQDAIIH
jgi:transposase